MEGPSLEQSRLELPKVLRVEANLASKQEHPVKPKLETHIFEDFIEFDDLTLRRFGAVLYIVNKKGAHGHLSPTGSGFTTEERRNVVSHDPEEEAVMAVTNLANISFNLPLIIPILLYTILQALTLVFGVILHVFSDSHHLGLDVVVKIDLGAGAGYEACLLVNGAMLARNNILYQQHQMKQLGERFVLTLQQLPWHRIRIASPRTPRWVLGAIEPIVEFLPLAPTEGSS
ncbi:hypothetical protein Tco_1090394 [Tanacetum coccineum]|uniref:Uncharacterized protein n=1 Tax=Tanacetum coccineum TaxID=301880 RepID=A0ABQ5I424_9ASTR